MPHVTLSEGVTPIDISENAYAGKTESSRLDVAKTSFEVCRENIRQALVNLDPANAETYNANAQTYSEQIKQVDQKLQKTVVQKFQRIDVLW